MRSQATTSLPIIWGMQGKVTVAEVNGHGAAANVNAVPAEVLVVDDEPVTARGYARALAAAGYKVSVAHDGREAAALAKGQRFDAIVSDIAMPDMDGLALLRAIRETDLDVPMIFMTGSPALESALEAIEYGAFRYLVKPVAHDAMLEVVERAVARSQAGAGPARGGAGARARRETDRRSGRPRGALRLGGREALGGGAADRVVVGAAAPSPTRRCCAPTSRRCAARSTSSTPPSGWGGPPSWGGSSASTWREHLHETPPPANLFVNLHPADLEDEELYADDGALTPFASQVVLEITERAALDRIHELQSRVTRLRALGYRIAIDDLGAGYAGLTSFAQLEPEVVKVDMSLVRGIDSSPVKQKLVRSIIALCTELGIQLVAEGIETPAERDTLVVARWRSLPGLPVRPAGPRLPDPRPIVASHVAWPAARRPAPRWRRGRRRCR